MNNFNATSAPILAMCVDSRAVGEYLALKKKEKATTNKIERIILVGEQEELFESICEKVAKTLPFNKRRISAIRRTLNKGFSKIEHKTL